MSDCGEFFRLAAQRHGVATRHEWSQYMGTHDWPAFRKRFCLKRTGLSNYYPHPNGGPDLNLVSLPSGNLVAVCPYEQETIVENIPRENAALFKLQLTGFKEHLASALELQESVSSAENFSCMEIGTWNPVPGTNVQVYLLLLLDSSAIQKRLIHLSSSGNPFVAILTNSAAIDAATSTILQSNNGWVVSTKETFSFDESNTIAPVASWADLKRLIQGEFQSRYGGVAEDSYTWIRMADIHAALVEVFGEEEAQSKSTLTRRANAGEFVCRGSRSAKEFNLTSFSAWLESQRTPKYEVEAVESASIARAKRRRKK